MTVTGWAQILLFATVLTALVRPLGTYIAVVFARPPSAREQRLIRPDPQDWKAYARCAIVFSGVCMLALYATLRLQRGPGAWDLSFNTAASFVSNTSWQYYAGETTLTAFSADGRHRPALLPERRGRPGGGDRRDPRLRRARRATRWATSGWTCGAGSPT